MEAIQQILIKERTNENYIYLYNVDNHWIAYERSAFYLFSICSVDHIFRYTDSESSNTIVIAVLKDNYRKVNPQLEIIKDTAEQIVFSCGITCKGFEYWKNGLFFSSKNRNVKERISQLFQIMPKTAECSV